jgi:hypothetical protein
MASKYLDGAMVARSVSRACDHRNEPRSEAGSATATIVLRGRRHTVPLVNVSRSGAMVILSLIPHIGETISVQLVGRAPVVGTVCWVRDGKIGITFAAPVE